MNPELFLTNKSLYPFLKTPITAEEIIPVTGGNGNTPFIAFIKTSGYKRAAPQDFLLAMNHLMLI